MHGSLIFWTCRDNGVVNGHIAMTAKEAKSYVSRDVDRVKPQDYEPAVEGGGVVL